MQKKRKIDNLKIKLFMTKKPYTVEENTLATEVLSLMNKKKNMLTEIPFGPSIIFAAFIYFFKGQEIIEFLLVY